MHTPIEMRVTYGVNVFFIKVLFFIRLNKEYYLRYHSQPPRHSNLDKNWKDQVEALLMFIFLYFFFFCLAEWPMTTTRDINNANVGVAIFQKVRGEREGGDDKG